MTGLLNRLGDPPAFRGTVNANGEVRLALDGSAVALVGTLTLPETVLFRTVWC